MTPDLDTIERLLAMAAQSGVTRIKLGEFEAEIGAAQKAKKVALMNSWELEEDAGERQRQQREAEAGAMYHSS